MGDQQTRIVTRFLKPTSEAKRKGVKVGWTIVGIDNEDHTNSSSKQFSQALLNVYTSPNGCILRFQKTEYNKPIVKKKEVKVESRPSLREEVPANYVTYRPKNILIPNS